jgi:molybdopterin-guanine dinucleotide biosynthesis protein A
MGRDKALLPFGSRPVAAYIASQVEHIASTVFFVGPPEVYLGLGYQVLPDLYPGYGPVGAIATALSATKTEWNIVLACDMPGVRPTTIRTLVEAAVEHGAKCVYPVSPDGHEHPLCGVYHRSTREIFEAAVTKGEHRLLSVVKQLRPYVVHLNDVEQLRNVNTPEEWEAVAGGTEH